MRQYRAPLRGQGTSIVGLYWAGCIINMSGFDLRQAQRAIWGAGKPPASSGGFREHGVKRRSAPKTGCGSSGLEMRFDLALLVGQDRRFGGRAIGLAPISARGLY
jgi:hypothetical protein